jgi:virulence factor Mce-like protein
MRRRTTATLAASPTMVGAITVMIVIVAVFLAYNANNGLPFVPTYGLSAEVKDAQTLVPGNEVRIGGLRVGVVTAVDPEVTEDGSYVAKLDLKLDKEVDPLPADSTITIRARSALGLKYLEIKRGDSSDGLEAGSVIPASQERPEPIDIDQVLSTFDAPTRSAIQTNLAEFGAALAGRGPDLNEAIGDLRPAVRLLQPVMRNLADPATALRRFFPALEATAREVAPVAEQQADLFVAGDTTFAALARVARPFIQETISESPPTLDTATADLPVITRFLNDSADLFTDLEPAATSLEANAPAIASALEVGAPVLRDAHKLNRKLPPVAAALRALNDDSASREGIRRLIGTQQLLSPTLRFVTPAQSVCNYATILFRNGANLVKTGDGAGTAQLFVAQTGPGTFEAETGGDQVLYQPNNEVTPSSGVADGATNVPVGQEDINFLHYNPYPNTASPGQPRECEAGNEPWNPVLQIGNPPGNQGTTTLFQK